MLDSILKQVQISWPTVGIISFIIMVGAAREYWVWGVVYRRKVAESDFWRNKTLELIGLGEEAVDVASEMAEEMP